MTIRFDPFENVLNGKEFSKAAATQSHGHAFYRRFGKRALDYVIVIATLPISVPLICLMCIIVASDGGRPIYTSARVGRGGKVFRMFKLRTMVHDAEARLDRHLAASPQARAEWMETQKLRNDPRITRFGRLLRKSSFDELPQIFNVLLGHMSIVGPRPMLPEQREIYPGIAYYALRPGLTGPWQVWARNEASFQSRADYDHGYEMELSLMSDLKIMFKTLGVVFRGTGY